MDISLAQVLAGTNFKARIRIKSGVYCKRRQCLKQRQRESTVGCRAVMRPVGKEIRSYKKSWQHADDNINEAHTNTKV